MCRLRAYPLLMVIKRLTGIHERIRASFLWGCMRESHNVIVVWTISSLLCYSRKTKEKTRTSVHVCNISWDRSTLLRHIDDNKHEHSAKRFVPSWNSPIHWKGKHNQAKNCHMPTTYCLNLFQNALLRMRKTDARGASEIHCMELSLNYYLLNLYFEYPDVINDQSRIYDFFGPGTKLNSGGPSLQCLK